MLAQNKNTIYLSCIKYPWLKIAEILKEKANITPKYFVGFNFSNENHIDQKEIDALFQGCHFQSMNDAWKGIGFPSQDKPMALDSEFLTQLAPYELTAMKMMDRMDPVGYEFPFTHRQWYFRDLVAQWISIVENRAITLVISPSVPHRVYDYALYAVCKIKKIQFIYFEMVWFGQFSFIREDVGLTPYYIRVCPMKVTGDLKPQISKRIENVKKDFMASLPSFMSILNPDRLGSLFINKIRSLVKNVRFNFKNTLRRWLIYQFSFYVKKNRMPNQTALSGMELFLRKIYYGHKLKKLKNYYESLCIKKPYSNQFVVFALHFQPEATTSPNGGVFVDQIAAIQCLCEGIPDNVEILVKEHKAQFSTKLEAPLSCKSKVYYQRISNLSKRVKFVSIYEDSALLMDSALAVATVTGTMGWEAAIRGTPSIIFGSAWYEGLPRVFRVGSSNEIKGIWNKLLTLKSIDLERDILLYHKNLSNYLIEGTICLPFFSKKYLLNSPVEISNGILKYLEQANDR